MVRSNEEYLSNSLEYVYKPEIGQRVKYTANTATTIMTAANTRLDGTGTIYTILTSGSANGTLIKTVTLKGTVSTTRGMVRFYVADGGGTPVISLIAEIEIPAASQNSTQETFAISIELDYMLLYQYTFRASTENAENMVVVAEGLGIEFP